MNNSLLDGFRLLTQLIAFIDGKFLQEKSVKGGRPSRPGTTKELHVFSRDGEHGFLCCLYAVDQKGKLSRWSFLLKHVSARETWRVEVEHGVNSETYQSEEILFEAHKETSDPQELEAASHELLQTLFAREEHDKDS